MHAGDGQQVGRTGIAEAAALLLAQRASVAEQERPGEGGVIGKQAVDAPSDALDQQLALVGQAVLRRAEGRVLDLCRGVAGHALQAQIRVEVKLSGVGWGIALPDACRAGDALAQGGRLQQLRVVPIAAQVQPEPAGNLRAVDADVLDDADAALRILPPIRHLADAAAQGNALLLRQGIETVPLLVEAQRAEGQHGEDQQHRKQSTAAKRNAQDQ